MSTPTEEAATVQDIATMLRVSPDKIYRLAAAGDIPAFKIGRLWRFWPSAVRTSVETSKDPWARPTRSSARRHTTPAVRNRNADR